MDRQSGACAAVGGKLTAWSWSSCEKLACARHPSYTVLQQHCCDEGQVSDVDTSENVPNSSDDTDMASAGRGRQPALTGCPWHDVNEMLQSVGLRPTRQRMALGWLLFGKGARHLTAEMLYEEATLAKVPVSLATVYNTLNQLTDSGLLRQVSVDGTKTYFDTNVTAHHHYYLENNHELVDIPDPHLILQKMPDVPEGYEISRIDMVVRLRKKR
jgi:Fur family iron response transcriptional regulator